MKLEKWANIAEILSGVAVVVTLVFLIIGINNNTNVTRAAVYGSSVASLNQMGRVVMGDPDLLRIFEIFVNRDTEWSELDEMDQVRMVLMLADVFRTYDQAYFNNKYGVLGAAEWERFERQICNNYALVRTMGQTEVVSTVISIEFGEFVQGVCEE